MIHKGGGGRGGGGKGKGVPIAPPSLVPQLPPKPLLMTLIERRCVWTEEVEDLEVKNLGCLIKALLSKWCWRFAMERGTSWNKVIKGKYGKQEGGSVLFK